MNAVSRSGGGYLHVCPPSGLQRVAARLDRFDLLTLLSPDHTGQDHRGLACGRHLELSFHDIVEAKAGLVAPGRDMMAAILDFARENRDRTMLIHC